MKLGALCDVMSLAGCPLSEAQKDIVFAMDFDEPTGEHTFPRIASVDEVNAYTEWLVQMGKGSYPLMISEHYLAVIPQDGNRFCDDSKVAFLTAVFK